MQHVEIERKFLVDHEKWSDLIKPPGVPFLQGYLSIDSEKVVRVRVAGDKGFITIKGKSATIAHPEYEYEIPAADATELIEQFSGSVIKKVRTFVKTGNHTWEVDEFGGDNQGLLLAEIELSEESETFDKPAWVTEEVTGDKRYYNAYLSLNPYGTWK